MKKERNNLLDLAPDAIIGYSTLVLGSVCFLLLLVAIVAFVRFVTGVGAA